MEQAINNPPTIVTRKKRNVFVAFLFSLLTPGLGQIYNGQVKKAILFFSILLLYPLFFGIVRGTTFFYGLLLFYVVDTLLRIYIITDSIINAKRQKQYELKRYNTWYYYLLIAIVISGILTVYNVNKTTGTQSFQISTTANSPTFQSGDWVVADMRAYENNQPDYGDIVVFSGLDGDLYLFRIIGCPNDKIEIKDNTVSINNKPTRATPIKETIHEGIPIIEFEEELPNGCKYIIYKFKQPLDYTKTDIKNIIVPADSYYLLGDNRDNAADSRYIGFVKKEDIRGRILFSYWG